MCPCSIIKLVGPRAKTVVVGRLWSEAVGLHLPHAPTALIPKESTSPLPKSTLNRWRIRLDVASGSNRGEKGDGYFFAAFLSGIQAPAATAGRLEAPPFPFDMSGGAEGATSGAARQSVSSATVAQIGSWYRRRRHR
jgi:hypothetical protein